MKLQSCWEGGIPLLQMVMVLQGGSFLQLHLQKGLHGVPGSLISIAGGTVETVVKNKVTKHMGKHVWVKLLQSHPGYCQGEYCCSGVLDVCESGSIWRDPMPTIHMDAQKPLDKCF